MSDGLELLLEERFAHGERDQQASTRVLALLKNGERRLKVASREQRLQGGVRDAQRDIAAQPPAGMEHLKADLGALQEALERLLPLDLHVGGEGPLGV